MKEFDVVVASADFAHYAEEISHQMEESAKARGTGIAKRPPEYLVEKMNEGKAIIATTKDGEWVGFSKHKPILARNTHTHTHTHTQRVLQNYT